MNSNLSNDTFLRWDPAQVSSFVSSILPEDEKHSSVYFLDHNIEGSQLPFLTTEHLKEIGIESLSTRLQLKKGISELIETHYQTRSPSSLHDIEYQLHNVNINNNYVNVESLKLATILMKDMIKKLGDVVQQRMSNEPSPISPTQHQDMKRLNDNFNKLKTDLIPVIKQLKESKPLPTPTLDPGSKVNAVESPTFSFLAHNLMESSDDAPISDPHLSGGSGKSNLGRSNTIATSSTSASNGNTTIPSPTFSNRSSSGTFLSMGSGMLVQQAVTGSLGAGNRPRGDSLGQRGTMSASSSSRTLNRPRLVESKSANIPTGHTLRLLGSLSNTHNVSQSSTTGGSTEPLKQLRASSDDSCLKILQQAMKRHRIPRNDWSKYVLVICYGNKERILKLAERPVIIFKELQELGKHPAIMLRQLATDPSMEDDSNLYENSRIVEDIPGGTL